MNIKINRRQFMLMSAATGSALVLGIGGYELTRFRKPAARDSMLSAWIEIHPDNSVVLTLAKSEMGQGVSTALPMMIAEELSVNWKSIRLQQADEPLNPVYGRQETGGSSSVSDSWKTLRTAGAIVRELLITAASRVWRIERGALIAREGFVHDDTSQRQIAYGDLVSLARTLPIPQSITLKDKRDYQFIGKDVVRLDLADRLNGKAHYGADTRFKDSVVAVIRQCPQFGGHTPQISNLTEIRSRYKTLTLFETIIVEHTFVAVVAKDFWVASKILNELHIDWQIPGDSDDSSGKIYELLNASLEKPGYIAKQQGQFAPAQEDVVYEATYRVPFQAHATMEPMSCTAWFHDGIIEVWAPTQNPGAAYAEVIQNGRTSLGKLIDRIGTRITRETPNDVVLHTTYLGCGLGRRLQQDYVAQAVLIARQIDKPVSLVWSREEDMTHDYYRPGNLARLQAVLDTNGYPKMWRHKIAGPSIGMYLWPSSIQHGNDPLAVSAASDLAYRIPVQHIEYVAMNTNIPVGLWRSVGYSQNTFAIETFIDELAAQAKLDPLEYRLHLLEHDARHTKTLRVAAERAGWHNNQAGYGLGIASQRSFGSYVSTVVIVRENNNAIQIEKVLSVIDCGQAIHPDGIKAQVEGSVVFALSAAIYGEITFENGQVQQTNFHTYPIMGMRDTPQIEVSIIDSDQEPAGVGEPGVPPVAPALINAIFALTGRRIRTLPFSLRYQST